MKPRELLSSKNSRSFRCSGCDRMSSVRRFVPWDATLNEFVALCPECFYLMDKRGFSTVLELLELLELLET